MSLVGNLEDLGLGEILQIVSLSRKSGSLSLYSRGREGKIVFRCGQVVRASSGDFQLSLGQILVHKGIIDARTLYRALEIQKDADFRERLGSILIKRFNVSGEVIEDVVREQIEKVVYSLFAWAEGTFDFELQDSDEDVDLTQPDPLQFRLEQGVNPQFLAIEGSRIIDEMRRNDGLQADGDSDRAEAGASESEVNVDFAFDLLRDSDAFPGSEVATGEEGRGIVVVDDESAAREAIGRLLCEGKYPVLSFEKSEDALIHIDTVYRSGKRPILLVDLIMPKMDGSGAMGGLELLELIHTNFRDLHVLVMSDLSNSDGERAVRGMGYPVLIKPRKSEFADSGAAQSFGRKLLAELDRLTPGPDADDQGHTIDLGEELRMEMGEEFAPSPEASGRSTGIALLRGILEELNNPSLGGGIILLVLRFAAEFMNRAVIFIVEQDAMVGLGQFGIVDVSGKADARVRNIRIPLDEDSIFRRVVDRKLPVKPIPEGTQWDTYLFDRLGEGMPYEFFLGPIVSEGKVVALLYGDNLPEKRKIGDTDSLEIFLSQAGMAMEKALLQRRLKERNPEGT